MYIHKWTVNRGKGFAMGLWFASALLPEGWKRNVRIELDGGLIASVESDRSPEQADTRHAVALPGMPNLHSHSFQRAMSGLTEIRGDSDDSFWTWRETMYRFVDRLDPDDVEAIAALAFAEMLESGFTRVGEFHYLHHDRDGRSYSGIAELSERIAAAAAETGIGLTLLPVFYAHGGFGGKAPGTGQRRFVTDLDAYARLFGEARRAIAPLPDAKIGFAPHSLRAVAPEELRGLIAMNGGEPFHIHIAEQMREVEECEAWSGRRPVRWLIGEMPVDQRWCLVHATHMDKEEVLELASTGATAGLCPITEANLGDGIFPAPAFVAAGGSIGVGSDSNVRIDLPLELSLLEYGQRLKLQRRNVMATGAGQSTGRALYLAACSGGARALGQHAGGIEAGAAADIVALADDESTDSETILNRWIFGSRSSLVDTVWRYGRIVVKEGRHVFRDAINSRYSRSMSRLMA
jgi:formimidoylglutamate deiminase